MTHRAVRLIAPAAAAVCLQAAGARVGAQSHRVPPPGAAPRSWALPRTADGQPDLQGIWHYRTLSHEGNYGLQNILKAGRATDKKSQ